MRTPRLIAAVVVAVLTASLMTACRFDEREAGNGELVVYSGRTRAYLGPMIRNFEELTGMKVTVRYGDSNQLATDFMNDAETVDVYLAGESSSLVAVGTSDVAGTMPDTVVDKVPTQYRDPEGRWVAVSARAGSLIYNPDLIGAEELPTTLADLADPRWHGKFAIAGTSNVFQGMVAAAIQKLGPDETLSLVNGIAGNQPVLTNSISEVVDVVGRGEVPFGLADTQSWPRSERDHRHNRLLAPRIAPLYFAGGDIGAAFTVCGLVVSRHSADDREVRHFVGLLLSQESQRFFANYRFEYPLASAAEPPLTLPDVATIDPPDIDYSALPSPSEVGSVLASVQWGGE